MARVLENIPKKGPLKPQISPLRCASVEMTPLRAGRDDKRRDDSSEREAVPVQQLLSPDEPPFPLSSRPKRSAVERSATSLFGGPGSDKGVGTVLDLAPGPFAEGITGK